MQLTLLYLSNLDQVRTLKMHSVYSLLWWRWFQGHFNILQVVLCFTLPRSLFLYCDKKTRYTWETPCPWYSGSKSRSQVVRVHVIQKCLTQKLCRNIWNTVPCTVPKFVDRCIDRLTDWWKKHYIPKHLFWWIINILDMWKAYFKAKQFVS